MQKKKLQDEEDEAPDYISDDGKEQQKDNPDTHAKHYQSLYLASFKDYLLKEELLRAINEAGFERPSEV